MSNSFLLMQLVHHTLKGFRFLFFLCLCYAYLMCLCRFMRSALNNPRDIMRKRREAPSSSLGIWKLNNSRRKEHIFYQPLLTGRLISVSYFADCVVPCTLFQHVIWKCVAVFRGWQESFGHMHWWIYTFKTSFGHLWGRSCWCWNGWNSFSNQPSLWRANSSY